MKFVNTGGLAGDIMLVGDYPTKEEYANGQAFSGSIGRFFNGIFRSKEFKEHGWSTEKYCTYVIKAPIPGYESQVKKVKRNAFDKIWQAHDWLGLLKEEIKEANPNVILCFGEIALNYLTGMKSVDKYRGSILPLVSELAPPKREINVVPILSPRTIWAANEAPYAYTLWDIAKAFKIRKLRSLFKPNELIWIVRNYNEFSNWWERARKGEYITFDIETHHGFITCISFCHDGYEAISVPLLVGQKKDGLERGLYYKLIQEILSSTIPKVNQNIKYDWMVLERWGFTVENIVGDTMLAAHTIYSELPKGLDFLCSIYTDQPYYKDEGKKFDPKIHSSDRLLIYNAKDSLVTWQIWRDQQSDLEVQGVKKFFFNNVMPAFFTYKKMEERGIRVDMAQVDKLLWKYQPQYHDCCSMINLIAGEPINPLSPKQVGRLVYEILECPKSTHKTPAGETAYSTDEETIEELYVNKVNDEGRKAVLKRLLLARKLSKIITFLKSPISPDGFVRTSFKLHGTETGRTSAGKSLEAAFTIEKNSVKEIECGFSFQTIPKHGFEFGAERIGDDLRTIFVPSPGYVFVEGDQSQAEARIVCVLAEDWDTLKLFDSTDIHIVTATWITGKKFDDITKEERQELGKKPRHAGNYNMGASRLSMMTHKPLRECQVILEKFHAASPNIRGLFHTGVREQMSRHRFLRTPHGRRRDFFGRITDDMFKEGYATIPQATVSDHNKFTILRSLCSMYSDEIARPVSESHDSLTFEVRSEFVSKFANDFSDAIKVPINFINCSLSRDFNLVIPGEIQVGEISWGEMVKWKG